MNFKKLHIVIGMVKDKDISGVLKLLPEDAKYYFTNAHIARALPAGEMKNKASEFNLKGNSFPDVNEALKSALENSSTKDLILICGSFFVIGEVDLDLLKSNEKNNSQILN